MARLSASGKRSFLEKSMSEDCRGRSSEACLEAVESQSHLASVYMVCAEVLEAVNGPGYILLLVLNRNMG